MNGRRRDHQVWLGERVSRFPAFLHQKPPLQHDVFRDLQNAPLEHGPHLAREPAIQLRPTIGFGDTLDAEANFRQGNDADMNLAEGASGHEVHNPWFRPWPPQFR